MIEIILGSIILALVITNVYLFQRMMEMNEKYMKAIMAKNLTAYNESVILDKVEPKETKMKEDEFVPVSEAEESVFKKYLKNIENGGQNELPEV